MFDVALKNQWITNARGIPISLDFLDTTNLRIQRLFDQFPWISWMYQTTNLRIQRLFDQFPCISWMYHTTKLRIQCPTILIH